MLTAHALNAETLLASVRKGAISYLPKEKLAEIDQILNDLLAAQAAGEPTWKLLFEKLGDFFDENSVPAGKKRTKRSGPTSAAPIRSAKEFRPDLRGTRRLASKGI